MPNDIIEIFPDGRREVRFRPLLPEQVPEAMVELCLGYRHAICQLQVSPLLASACLVLDFLCIHPFRDGNGRRIPASHVARFLPSRLRGRALLFS